MIWRGLSIGLLDSRALLPSPISTRALGYAALLSICCLAGCIQDSPPSSKDRSVSLLVELLGDERQEIRRTAAESLGKIGDPQPVDSILPLLHDSVSIVREAAVLALGRMGPRATDEIVAQLTHGLQDPSESVRRAAVVAIGEIEPGPGFLGPVVGLLQSPDEGARRAAARALFQVDSSQWLAALIAAGRDTDPDVRQAIVAAVGEWGGAGAAAWLRERLAHDSSPGVRAEAAYRMGLLNDPDTRAALGMATVSDADSGVRNWAKRGGR